MQVVADTAKPKVMFNRMEDLMEQSGGFVFIGFEPYIAIHDATLAPTILSDGRPDPVPWCDRWVTRNLARVFGAVPAPNPK